MSAQNHKQISATCNIVIRCDKAVDEYKVLQQSEESFECDVQGCYKYFSKIEDLQKHISNEHEAIYMPKK